MTQANPTTEQERRTLAAVLDSWARSNVVLINLLRAIPNGGLDARAMAGSPTVAEMLTHMHHERMVSVLENAPECAGQVPAQEWHHECESHRIAEMLIESGRRVRDGIYQGVNVLTTVLRRIIFLLALGPLSVSGQTPPGAVTPTDAVSASPEQFKVLLANPQVRVIEYVLLPGERDQWHTHPPKVSYVVSGGTLRITTADGQSFLADEKAGSVHRGETVGRHFVENVGKTPVRIVLVETRSALPSSSIVGTWRLESIVDTLADGSRADWMGSRPTGAIIYSASGHMSVQLMRDPRPVLPEAAATGEDRARLAGTDPFGALGAEELRDVVRGYYAYFGRYEVSAAGDAITHVVETSLRPNEVGVAYHRAIRIEGGRLFISLEAVEDGVSRHRVLTWRRAE